MAPKLIASNRVLFSIVQKEIKFLHRNGLEYSLPLNFVWPIKKPGTLSYSAIQYSDRRPPFAMDFLILKPH